MLAGSVRLLSVAGGPSSAPGRNAHVASGVPGLLHRLSLKGSRLTDVLPWPQLAAVRKFSESGPQPQENVPKHQDLALGNLGNGCRWFNGLDAGAFNLARAPGHHGCRDLSRFTVITARCGS